MKQLKESFKLNGLQYILIKRNEYVALYCIAGEYTDKILHYEVSIIYIRKDQYEERERIAKNDDFGRDRSRCYNNKDIALKYYDKLSARLKEERNLSQGVPKPIAGVEQNDNLIPEYHPGD